MPTQQPIGATGSLLAREQGIGPGIIPTRIVKVGSRLTLRVSCSGSGPVQVADATGRPIMGTSGCKQGVVFSSQWSSTSHDGRVISLRVEPTTSWVVEVWSGTVPDHAPTA